jgi:hypothetical protein
MTYLPQLERELLVAHAQLGRRGRWTREWLARRAYTPRSGSATRVSHRRPWMIRGLGAAPVLLAVSVTIVIAVVALAALGHGRTSTNGPGPNGTSVGTSVGTRHGKSPRAQALALYAPVAAFDRSTTAQQRARMTAAPRVLARTIDRCQTRYAKPLFRSMTVFSKRYKVYRVYEYGQILEDTQAREAPGARQVAVAAQSWDTMLLPTAKFQRIARALGGEIDASLSAPKLNGCSFLRDLEQHKFSLSWAQHSLYGVTAVRFVNQTSKESSPVAFGYRYLLQQTHLLTSRQWSGIVNFAGIQG